MTQASLDFDGTAYEADKDQVRLTAQMKDVHAVLLCGSWHTVDEIHDSTGHPHNSVSAQIRNLRKSRFGGYSITGRYRNGTRIFEYKLEV